MNSRLPAFYVARAEPVDGTYVRIYFSVPVENNAANCSKENFTFGGSFALTAVSAVAFNDYIDVQVNQMKADAYQTVTVANVADVHGRLISPSQTEFVGAGDSPRFSAIVAVDSRKVRVVFDEAMRNDAALLNIDNYIFSGFYDLTALSVAYVNATTVDVYTTEMVSREEYKLQVNNLSDALDNLMAAQYSKKAFTSSNRPKLLEAVALTNPLRVRLSFDRDIAPTSEFLHWRNFTFFGPKPLIPLDAKMNGAYAVEVYYATAVQDGAYTVTVGTAKDDLGRDIDPYYNTIGFTSEAGYEPLDLQLASHPSHLSVLLRFNQAVEPNSAMYNVSNYTISGGSTSVVPQQIIMRDPNVVYVIINALESNYTYTVTVRNLTSVYGFGLRDKTATFTYKYMKVISASSSAINTADIIFDREVSYDLVTLDPDNYLVYSEASGTAWSFAISQYSNKLINLTFSRDMEIAAAVVTPANYNISYVASGGSVSFTVAQFDSTHLNVAMDKDMRLDDLLTDPDNYTVTYVNTGVISNYSALATSSTEVVITFNKDMELDDNITDPSNYSVS